MLRTAAWRTGRATRLTSRARSKIDWGNCRNSIGFRGFLFTRLYVALKNERLMRWTLVIHCFRSAKWRVARRPLEWGGARDYTTQLTSATTRGPDSSWKCSTVTYFRTPGPHMQIIVKNERVNVNKREHDIAGGRNWHSVVASRVLFFLRFSTRVPCTRTDHMLTFHTSIKSRALAKQCLTSPIDWGLANRVDRCRNRAQWSWIIDVWQRCGSQLFIDNNNITSPPEVLLLFKYLILLCGNWDDVLF